jgi:putative MATE family efflux protein
VNAPARDPLLTRPIWWLVMRQGFPMAVGMACHALFNLVDLWMVGEFGEDAVAGAHCATTINFLPMIVGNGISVATMALMAQELGAGRVARARRIATLSQAAMLVLGILLGGLCVLLAAPSIDLQAVAGSARAIGIEYLVVTSIGTVTMFALMQATAVMRANGEAGMPFALLVGANLLNIGLNFPFMYGWDALGMPAFGPVGAAWASTASRGVGCVVAWLWLARAAHPLRLRLADLRGAGDGLGLRMTRSVFELALPQSVQMLARVAPVVLLTRFAGHIAGNSAITALGVTTRLDTLVLFASIGFASAATAVAGRNIGAGRPERASRTGWHAGLQAFVFAAIIIGVLAWYAPSLIDLFVQGVGAGVRDAGTAYLRIAAWGHPFAAFCIAAAGAVNGAGRSVPPMLFDLAGLLLLFLPAGTMLVTLAAAPGLAALWTIAVATQCVLLVAYAVYLWRGRWLAPAARSASVSG